MKKFIMLSLFLVILLTAVVVAEEMATINGCLYGELSSEPIMVERVSISDGQSHYYFNTEDFDNPSQKQQMTKY